MKISMKSFCLAVLFTASITTSSHAIAANRLVAFSGDHAPGTVGDFTGSFTAPVLNNLGQTAFRARAEGSGGYGLWTEAGGTLGSLVQHGDTVDGQEFYSPPYTPLFNDIGTATFWSEFYDYSEAAWSDADAIWTTRNSQLEIVARNETPATPGASAGSELHFNWGREIAMNQSGQVMLHSGLSGGGYGSTDSGVWISTNGQRQLVAITQQQAPGLLDGVRFDSIVDSVLNSSGAVAFTSVLTGTLVNSDNWGSVWTNRTGPLTMIAREGGRPPSFRRGNEFAGFSTPSINAAGQTAFRANLRGLDVQESEWVGDGLSIWSEASGSLELVVRGGELAPGTSDNFSGFTNPLLSSNGDVAFYGSTSGASSNDTGLWIGNSNNMMLVALEGDSAPGIDEAVFRGFRQDNNGPTGIEGTVINSQGQVAFGAYFGFDANPNSSFGIWAQDESDELQGSPRLSKYQSLRSHWFNGEAPFGEFL